MSAPRSAAAANAADTYSGRAVKSVSIAIVSSALTRQSSNSLRKSIARVAGLTNCGRIILISLKADPVEHGCAIRSSPVIPLFPPYIEAYGPCATWQGFAGRATAAKGLITSRSVRRGKRGGACRDLAAQAGAEAH